MNSTLLRLSVLSVKARWALVSLALGFAALVQAADVRVYVQYAPGQKSNAQAALARAGARTHFDFSSMSAIVVSIPQQARAALEQNPAVQLIEDDPVRGLLSFPQSPQIKPYGITMVQADLVPASPTDVEIKVGVIDSGVHMGHEDFVGVKLTGEGEANWATDGLSHGTHVVGTIAAANNSVGVVGVSPGNVSIHMVKVFGDAGQWVYSSNLLAAANAAAAKGAKIISMSLGGSTQSTFEKSGLTSLYNNGVLLVAAAGNAGTTATSYPAGYASVISVAAVDATKALASFSQRNNDVELAAPGVAVLSTVSYLDTTTVAVGGATYSGAHIENSARGIATAALVYGNLANATSSSWAGKVVLVDRGTNSFYEKVHNVQLSGGIACIIANNEAGGFLGTLGDGNSSTIPAISVSMADGVLLKGLADKDNSATVSTLYQSSNNSYDYFDGTSMATPHVSGVAALIWSKYPTATNVQVRQALTSTAEDLGASGRDSSFGYGLVRAVNALGSLGALVGGGGGGGGDITPPTISELTATQGKGGSFDIAWKTNEPATSDVTILGTMYPDGTLVTTHKRAFRGTKGVKYDFTVISKDATGNQATQTSSITLK